MVPFPDMGKGDPRVQVFLDSARKCHPQEEMSHKPLGILV